MPTPMSPIRNGIRAPLILAAGAVVLAAHDVAAQELAAQELDLRELVAKLQSAQAEQRVAVLTALGRHGAAAADHAPTVARMLGDPAAAVRAAAVAALVALRPALAPTVPDLLGTVTRRPAQAPFLRTILVAGARAAPNLAAAASDLADRDPVARAAAIEQLGRCGRHAASYLDDVLALLGDRDPHVRATAAKYVARLDWNDAVCVALTKALRDPLARVRCNAAQGLLDRDDARAVAALRGQVQDPDVDVRVAVLRSLGRSGAAGDPAGRDIVASLRDRETRVRVAALEAVRAQRLRGPRVLGDVFQSLASDDREELQAALRAVARLGRAATPALDRCLELSRDDRQEVRREALAAAIALATEPRDGEVVLRLVEALADPHQAVRGEAQELLADWVHGS